MDVATRAKMEEARLRTKANTPSAQKLLELTGLQKVKTKFFAMQDKVEVSKERGDDLAKDNYHALFLGNPGTGKVRRAPALCLPPSTVH